MDKKKFYKDLCIIVLPIALQNLMSALVSASDALMLGWLDQESLSAVSLATQVQFVLNLFMAAITIGLTILAAQYWGKKDIESVEQILGIAAKYAFVISFAFAAAALCIPQVLMRIFTNDEVLIGLGAGYLRIVAFSYILTGLSQVYLCAMKNSGRITRSTVYGSVAMVLNLILNAILIFGLLGFEEYGIRGAALATLLARIAEFTLVCVENRKKNVVSFRLHEMKIASEMLKQDFKTYTTPVLMNEIAWGCGFTMFSVIMGHLGSDAIAANSIANIVKNILACAALGIGAGSSIIVGNELGRGGTELARKYGDTLCHISLVMGAISGLFVLVLSPLIVRFSGTLSTQAQEYLKWMLVICSYYMIGKAINSTVIGGIFCSGGDTRFGFICDTITMWLVVVPLGAIAAFILKWPVLAVYFILNLDELVKLPAVYLHYKKYNWVKNLTERN